MAGSSNGQTLFWTCYGEYRGELKAKRFLKFVHAKIEQDLKEAQYKLYVAENLKIMSETLANGLHAGSYVTVSLNDLWNPPKEDNRSVQEIRDHIWSKIGGGEQ